jgi:hypothetical protein
MTGELLRATGDLALSFTKAGNESKICKALERKSCLAFFLYGGPRPGVAVSRADDLVPPGEKGSDAATLTTRDH